MVSNIIFGEWINPAPGGGRGASTPERRKSALNLRLAFRVVGVWAVGVGLMVFLVQSLKELSLGERERGVFLVHPLAHPEAKVNHDGNQSIRLVNEF